MMRCYQHLNKLEFVKKKTFGAGKFSRLLTGPLDKHIFFHWFYTFNFGLKAKISVHIQILTTLPSTKEIAAIQKQ